MAAVEQCCERAIGFIDKPCKEVQMYVARVSPESLSQIPPRYQYEEAQLEVVRQRPTLIDMFKKASQRVKLEAIRHDALAIDGIKCPNDELLIEYEKNLVLQNEVRQFKL